MLSTLGNSRAAGIARSGVIIAASGAYAMLCGFGASILRAFLFITFREVASHFHSRSVPGVNILSAACLVHLCLDPQAISTLSFQLSYLSVASLMTLNPVLERFYPGRGPVKKIWQMMSVSISCQAFTAPLVWLKFHTLPKYFLLTNLIAIPLTEIFLPLGLLAAALSALGLDWPLLYAAADKLAGWLTGSLAVTASM